MRANRLTRWLLLGGLAVTLVIYATLLEHRCVSLPPSLPLSLSPYLAPSLPRSLAVWLPLSPSRPRSRTDCTMWLVHRKETAAGAEALEQAVRQERATAQQKEKQVYNLCL